MKNKRFVLLGMIALLCLFALWGCPKKAAVTATPEASQPTATVAEQAPAPEPVKEEPKPEPVVEPKAEPAPEVKEEAKAAPPAPAGLQPVYFDFDRAFIRDDAKQIMKANADWLKAHPGARVRIEGNCDERGTKEYNQALGQRRAVSAKKYLTDLGISAKRILLISYGKEKPVCTAGNEDCWQENRRDDLMAAE